MINSHFTFMLFTFIFGLVVQLNSSIQKNNPLLAKINSFTSLSSKTREAWIQKANQYKCDHLLFDLFDFGNPKTKSEHPHLLNQMEKKICRRNKLSCCRANIISSLSERFKEAKIELRQKLESLLNCIMLNISS